jgi:hypothetical protein
MVACVIVSVVFKVSVNMIVILMKYTLYKVFLFFLSSIILINRSEDTQTSETIEIIVS